MVLRREKYALEQRKIFKREELDSSIFENYECERVIIELHELDRLDEVIGHRAFGPQLHAVAFLEAFYSKSINASIVQFFA